MSLNMLVRHRIQRYGSAESVISVFIAAFPGQCNACAMCHRMREALGCIRNDNHSSVLLYKTLQDSKDTYDTAIPTGRKN